MPEDVRTMLRESNSFEHKGVTGVVFRYQLPDVQACMLAGEIPLPLLRRLKKVEEGKESEADLRIEAENIRQMRSFQERLVKAAVFEVNGLPCELDDEMLGIMHPDDFNALRSLAARDTEPEGKA